MLRIPTAKVNNATPGCGVPSDRFRRPAAASDRADPTDPTNRSDPTRRPAGFYRQLAKTPAWRRNYHPRSHARFVPPNRRLVAESLGDGVEPVQQSMAVRFGDLEGKLRRGGRRHSRATGIMQLDRLVAEVDGHLGAAGSFAAGPAIDCQSGSVSSMTSRPF